MRLRSASIVSLLALAAALSMGSSDAWGQAWPSFRGPSARGVADDQGLPASWRLPDAGGKGAGVLWTVAVPGLGHSSPVVWGDRVLVTTAVAEGSGDLALGDSGGTRLAGDEGDLVWKVLCYRASDGSLLWEREAVKGNPRAQRHVKASQANATPATDGETVVALLGSQGLFAYDLGGKALWQVDLGTLDPGLFGDDTSQWGHASSPVIHQGRVLVQVDRHRGSFLAAYDLATGKELWKVLREERPVWSTPTVHRVAGRDEVIVVGGYHTRGYDPATGKELWRYRDEAEVKTPTPFVAGDLVILAGGYRGRPIYALRAGGRGDLSPGEDGRSPHLAWKTDPGGPYTSTPLAYRGLVYAVRDTGILHAYDLESGEKVYSQRLDGTFSASPVASDGRIYLASENGEVWVLAAGRSYRLLARNDLGEPLLATPAIAGGRMILRGRSRLFAVGETPLRPSPPKGYHEAGGGRELPALPSGPELRLPDD